MRRIPTYIVALVFLAMAILLIASCGSPSDPQSALRVDQTDPVTIDGVSTAPSPNTYLPQVMIDDVTYYLFGDPDLTMDIPEFCYTGYITSTVSLTQRVTENGQANFNVDEGAPYAKFGDGYAILWNGLWTLFVTEHDLLAGVLPTPQRVPRNAPESAPRLDVAFSGNNGSEQRVQAIQLTTSWGVTYEDGTGRAYEADSAHALQVRLIDYDAATLSAGSAGGRIDLLFSDDYPPQSVSAKRWNAEYATGSQDIMGVFDKFEYVEISNGSIAAVSDGFDYIYEVYATWANGSSYYAFRVECSSADPVGVADTEPIVSFLEIQTVHYEFKSEDGLADIVVEQLVISGHPDMEVEERLNQSLSDISRLHGPPTSGEIFYHLTCDYTILGGRYLSARIYLQYDHESAVHPWGSLYCITIDLLTGREIELTDIMEIDDRLLQKLNAREFDYSSDGESRIIGIDYGVLDDCDYDDFFRQISEYQPFTFSENSIWLIVGVPHAIGDYWVLAFPYGSIAELLQPWFSDTIRLNN